MVKRADREIRILKNNHVPRFIKMGSSSLVPEAGPVLMFVPVKTVTLSPLS